MRHWVVANIRHSSLGYINPLQFEQACYQNNSKTVY